MGPDIGCCAKALVRIRGARADDLALSTGTRAPGLLPALHRDVFMCEAGYARP